MLRIADGCVLRAVMHLPFIQAEMSNAKRRLTAAEKAEKKRRKAEFRTVFINGKQKRVRRPPTIDGMEVEDFIRRNADPAFLQEIEMWLLIKED